MSTQVSKSIVVAELTTDTGQRIVFPLAFPQSTWFANKDNDMLRRLQVTLQKDVLDQGSLLEAVRMAVPDEFTERQIVVAVAASKDKLPRRETLHLFTAALADGRCHSFVPALGIEILSDGPESVDADVHEHIRLEHMRHGRFADLKKWIACQWYKEARLRYFSIDLNILGPDEQVQEKSQSMLPEVATPMRGAGLEVAGLDAAVTDLTNRMEGKFARSALLVGTENCGKTSLIHAYAKQRSQRDLSPIWETSAVRLVQALTRDGGWQKNLAVLCNELYEKESILYVGHLHELFEVGQYAGNNVSIGAALRDQLQRGRILLLAECTEAELEKLELQSAGYTALFQEVRMPRWSDREQQRIVAEAIAFRGREHDVAVTSDAVEESILLQRRYSPYSGFPGKPIRFLESLILQQKLHVHRVERGHVMAAFCAETGIPQGLLDARLPLDTDAMRNFFQRRIFGQAAAINLVCDTLLSIKATMTRAGKPIASLLLIGPTGVGKTETAKAMAEYMFGDADRMLRFDMSEYADAASILRLTGDLGSDDGALVTRIRQQPFSVVLFDEIEKAHYSFFDLLLQILGEGRLTGGKGQLANFCSAVIVMTSNIGATELQRHPLGLHPADKDSEGVVRHFEHAVQHYFRPELFNRLDHIVPFAPLTDSQRRPIIERELGLLRAREGMRERPMQLKLADGVIDHLCNGVHDDRYGARQMQRVIQDQLLFPLARALGGIPFARPLSVSVQENNGGALTIDCNPGIAPAHRSITTEADEMAGMRRQLQRILTGPVWTALVNQRYMLQLQKQKLADRDDHEQRFWELHGDAWRALNKLLLEAESLLIDIVDGEGELLQTQVEPADGNNFDLPAWTQRYMNLKKAALGISRPEANCCTIGIYGPLAIVEQLRDAYISIARQAGFEQRLQVVKVEHDVNISRDVARKIVLPQPANAKPDKAPIIGYELECRGESVYYFFSGEGGVWYMSEEEKKSLDMFVAVSQKPLEKHSTPIAVHRKSFFDSQPIVRKVKNGIVKDDRQGWQFPYLHVADFLLLLNARWLTLADDILTGEELA